MEHFTGTNTSIPGTGIDASTTVTSSQPGNGIQGGTGAQNAGNTGFSSVLRQLLTGPGGRAVNAADRNGGSPASDVQGQGLPPDGKIPGFHVVPGSLSNPIDAKSVTGEQPRHVMTDGQKSSSQRDHSRIPMRSEKPLDIHTGQDRNHRQGDFVVRQTHGRDRQRPNSAMTASRQADRTPLLMNMNSISCQDAEPEFKPGKVSRINQPLNHREWASSLANRVAFISRQGLQYATIRINPSQLGLIEVKVSIQSDHANIRFAAHHASVRDALESAIPRLKEMFAESGYQSVDVDVSSQQDSHGQAADELYASDRHSDRNDVSDEAGTDSNPRKQGVTLGVVDYYV